VGLDGTAPGRSEEQRFERDLSHAVLRALAGGFEGKLAALHLQADLDGRPPTPEEVNVLKAVLGELRQWRARLERGRPLLGREGRSHPSPDAPLALELIDELRADLLEAVPAAADALAAGDRATLACLLVRTAHGREVALRADAAWAGRAAGQAEAARKRQALAAAEKETSAVHRLVQRLRDGSLDAEGEAELCEHASTVPGELQSRIHELHVLIGRRRGGPSFRLCGVEGPEVAAWESFGLDPEAAGYWRAFGFAPDAAYAWREAGFEPELAAAWAARGFPLEEAVDWHNAGYAPGAARRARAAQAATSS